VAVSKKAAVSPGGTHTVVETHAFRRQAEVAGMIEEEINGLIVKLAADPAAGVAISGSGGCRKVRVAGRGKGKSGGYRVITFYSGPEIPVFLLAAFSKGERADLSQKERTTLAALTKRIVAEYRTQIVKASA
jgi:hypothetical protein